MLCCLISRRVPYYCLQYVWIPVNFNPYVNNGRPRMVKVSLLVECKVSNFYISRQLVLLLFSTLVRSPATEFFSSELHCVCRHTQMIWQTDSPRRTYQVSVRYWSCRRIAWLNFLQECWKSIIQRDVPRSQLSINQLYIDSLKSSSDSLIFRS